MKSRKTLAVGIAAASISAGVAAPAQAEATTPQTAQVAQAATPEPYTPITGSLRMAPVFLASPIVLPAVLLYAIWVRLNPGLG